MNSAKKVIVNGFYEWHEWEAPGLDPLPGSKVVFLQVDSPSASLLLGV